MGPSNSEKTAFSFHDGLYQFIRVVLGLSSAPATVLRVIKILLSSVKWKFDVVYSHDILISSRIPREHINHTGLVLSIFKESGVALELKKYAFFTNEIDYVRCVICLGRLKVAIQTTDPTRDLEIPTAETEL